MTVQSILLYIVIDNDIKNAPKNLSCLQAILAGMQFILLIRINRILRHTLNNSFLTWIEDFMHLKGGLHLHTTCSDGELTPQAIAEEYEKRGYDFIAFTDHDYMLSHNFREIYSNVSSNMIIFTGIELTVFTRGYVHINKIEGDKETLHVLNHIGDYGLSVVQIIERINSIKESIPLDAVEITSNGFCNKEILRISIPYPMIATDDAHTISGIGRAWVELDSHRNKDSIIRSIKNGDFWNCYL